MDQRKRPQGELEVVFHAATQGEAHSLVIFLAGKDIPAIASNETPFELEPRVLVSRDDKERAEQAIREFQQGTPDEFRDEIVSKDESWRDWPRCPECGRRRLVECPACGEARENFPLAEYQAEAATLESSRGAATSNETSGAVYPLLDCPQCSEVFRPRFYRFCAPCGHEFGDGKQVPREARGGWPIAYVFATLALIVALGLLWYAAGGGRQFFAPLPDR